MVLEQTLIMHELLASLGHVGMSSPVLATLENQLSEAYCSVGMAEGKFRGEEWVRLNQKAIRNALVENGICSKGIDR